MKQTIWVIAGILLTSFAIAGNQSAQFEIPLTVTDSAGGTVQLYCGVDPTGTDGMDASLGETEQPPVPFAGIFDARFIGDDISMPGLGQGLLRDYRQGTVSTTGNRLHELRYQVGNGSAITISWVLPTWATGNLQDLGGGSVVNVSMTGTGNYTVTNPSFISRLRMTISYTAPLPVQLASFTGSVVNQQGHVRLNWRTLTETNNYGFFVEKSQSSQTGYHTISSVIPGHGTTLEPQDYSWTDVSPRSGTWYYRLKQVDLDGTAHYSEAILPNSTTGVKERALPTEFALSQNYPNPFNPTTVIEYALPKQSNVKLEVYNLIGQHVATLVEGVKTAGYHSVQFNASGISSGLYFYRLTADGKVNFLKKMVLMK